MAEGQDPVQHPVHDYNLLRFILFHIHHHEMPHLRRNRKNKRHWEGLGNRGDPLPVGDHPGGDLLAATLPADQALLDERSAEGHSSGSGHSQHRPVL